MGVFIVVCWILTVLYVLLMVAYIVGWKKQPEFRLPANYEPKTTITVIIPARNESAHIGMCVSSVLQQNYPAHLLELIVVDDYSDDGTADVVRQFEDPRLKCLDLAHHLPRDKKINAYKKAALAAGISRSNGELIVTTDADCVVPNSWLLHIAAAYEQNQPAMIVAPVVFFATGGLSRVFQMIDFMGMQGITAATHALNMGNMSNGANLAFTRKAYDAVQGYEGIDHLASGDDYLLMMKVSKLPLARIFYLKSKSATVTTLPQPNWMSFLRQRIRWASKSGKYDDKKITATLLLVYLFNVAIVAAFATSIYNIHLFFLGAVMLGAKTIIEAIFMKPVVAFYDRKWTRPYFAFLQPLHIIYIVLAGFLGFVGKYEWKGRNVK